MASQGGYSFLHHDTYEEYKKCYQRKLKGCIQNMLAIEIIGNAAAHDSQILSRTPKFCGWNKYKQGMWRVKKGLSQNMKQNEGLSKALFISRFPRDHAYYVASSHQDQRHAFLKQKKLLVLISWQALVCVQRPKCRTNIYFFLHTATGSAAASLFPLAIFCLSLTVM